MKIIYEKDAIDALHKTMLEFFKTDGDDEPEFITASEKMLLSVNKAISNALKALPSAQPERCEDCGNFNKTRLLIPQPDIVRCKDCKHYAGDGMYCAWDIMVHYEHFYCYHAERGTDE